jgi:hypothetical protein
MHTHPYIQTFHWYAVPFSTKDPREERGEEGNLSGFFLEPRRISICTR